MALSGHFHRLAEFQLLSHSGPSLYALCIEESAAQPTRRSKRKNVCTFAPRLGPMSLALHQPSCKLCILLYTASSVHGAFLELDVSVAPACRFCQRLRH